MVFDRWTRKGDKYILYMYLLKPGMYADVVLDKNEIWKCQLIFTFNS